MAILTHGSDLSLSPALGPLLRPGGTVRTVVERLAAMGFGSVQLDVTLPGLRPRDLTPRGRRDLLALLGRRGVRPSGLDLFIPRRHYLDAEQVDRAMAAAIAAIELAGELGRLPVSLALPVRKLPGELRSALIEAADGQGVRLAVHAEDQVDALEQWVSEVDLPALGAAVDPAALLARGHDPAGTAQRLGKHLAVARLSDVERGSSDDDEPGEQAGRGEAVRCPVGVGDLDVTLYRVAVDLAANRAGPVVLDLRGLTRPMNAAAMAKQAWDNAGFTV